MVRGHAPHAPALTLQKTIVLVLRFGRVPLLSSSRLISCDRTGYLSVSCHVDGQREEVRVGQDKGGQPKRLTLENISLAADAPCGADFRARTWHPE